MPACELGVRVDLVRGAPSARAWLSLPDQPRGPGSRLTTPPTSNPRPCSLPPMRLMGEGSYASLYVNVRASPLVCVLGVGGGC